MKFSIAPILTTLFILLSCCFTTYAQSQEKIYSLHLISFAKGIQWPRQEETFVIGVLEYPPLANELKQSSLNTKINGRKIIVRELNAPEEVKGCHILFLPAYKAKLLPDVVTRIASDPTLIVSNKAEVAKKGAAINFILVDGKLNYEINCPAIEKRGMKVSTAIKSTGVMVN